VFAAVADGCGGPVFGQVGGEGFARLKGTRGSEIEEG